MADPNKAPHAPGYVPNPRYTQEDWNDVSDNPEWTDQELATAKPFAEVFPALAKTIGKRGPQKAPTKVATSLRLDPDLIAALKAKGPGWQTQVNDMLRAALIGKRAARPKRRAAVRKVKRPAKRA